MSVVLFVTRVLDCSMCQMPTREAMYWLRAPTSPGCAIGLSRLENQQQAPTSPPYTSHNLNPIVLGPFSSFRYFSSHVCKTKCRSIHPLSTYLFLFLCVVAQTVPQEKSKEKKKYHFSLVPCRDVNVRLKRELRGVGVGFALELGVWVCPSTASFVFARSNQYLHIREMRPRYRRVSWRVSV